MKYIPFILLALLIYILIRLENERAKTDWQVKTLKADIPEPAKLTPTIVTQVLQATPAYFAPVDYLSSYQTAKE